MTENIKVECIVEHNKFTYPADKNAVLYIEQTINSSLTSKNTEIKNVRYREEKGKLTTIFEISNSPNQDMIVGRIQKTLKKFSKKFNSKCYVKSN